MLRLFTSSLQRNARSLLTNPSLPRSALKTVTYASSKAWKSDSRHKPSPAPHTQNPTQHHNLEQNPTSHEDTRVIIVRGLPQTWNSEDISAYFEEDSKAISKVNLIKAKLGNNTGKALLTFGSSAEAESFVSKWDRTTIKVDNLTQMIAVQPFTMPKSQEQSEKQDIRTVYISNIAYNCTNDNVYTFASDFGEVVNVEVPTTSNNKNKGHAFITFKNADEAQKFVSFAHEKELLGRKIKAQLSQSKAEVRAQKKAPASSNFNFSKAPVEEEEPARDEYKDNLKLYKQLLNNQQQTSAPVRMAKFIKYKDVGSNFDL